MSQQERTKVHVAHCLIEGKMQISEAAVVLGLCERQVIRLKKGVLEQGDAFVIHKNKGLHPKHAVTDEQKRLIIELKNTKYQEANFVHFQELLARYESLSFSYSTIHRVLNGEGIKSPKKHSRRKAHCRRKRKAQEGIMIQIDASPHQWIIDGERVSLHGAIDDATGKILALFFRENECLNGYFEVIRQVVAQHGIPLSIYADRHTIFLSPKYDKLSLEDQLAGKTVNDTQFGRALKELGIQLIAARSPQAKGRIERLWETLQSRLPMEFKLANINSLDAANAFLQTFIDIYNHKFAVSPENSEPAYKQLPDSLNLDFILCLKETRSVDNGSVFSLDKQYYQIVKNGKAMPVIPKAKITVLINPKFGVMAQYSGSVYATTILAERPKKTVPAKIQSPPKSKAHKPSNDHYWRQYDKTAPKVFVDQESDREIAEALFSSRLAWR
jgi:transposase InsO family protein